MPIWLAGNQLGNQGEVPPFYVTLGCNLEMFAVAVAIVLITDSKPFVAPKITPPLRPATNDFSLTKSLTTGSQTCQLAAYFFANRGVAMS